MLKKNITMLLAVAVVSLALAGCSAPATQPGGSATTQVSRDDTIAIDDLPKAVVDGVQKEMPGAVLAKAKKQSDGNYRLSDVKLGKKEYTVTVSPDGTILNKAEDDD